ncbi:hypothetical protein [Pedobacter nyackensis]|uniref:hypothetical protein n=1 Tax=Pedobacter nyackensis TaxID=475255 RepID=UPI00292F57F3|nr:hypothetical protein [Pedobacter nyackensis]
MSINRLFRSITAALLIVGLPFGAFATNITPIRIKSDVDFFQDKKGKKQDRGRDSKKPEVKEVPQSRRQEKPGEVKSDKKGKSDKDNRRRN